MVLLQKLYLFYGIKYGFVAMLFSTPYIAFSILFSFSDIFIVGEKSRLGLDDSHRMFRQQCGVNFI
jgi:hypothetical protein